MGKGRELEVASAVYSKPRVTNRRGQPTTMENYHRITCVKQESRSPREKQTQSLSLRFARKAHVRK